MIITQYFKNIIMLGLFAVGSVLAQSSARVELRGAEDDEILLGGFELKSSRAVAVEAVGAGKEGRGYYKSRFYDPNNLFAYGWILNAETREMAWRLTTRNSRLLGESQLLRSFSGAVELPAGRYEVYFSTRKPNKIEFSDEDMPSLGKWLKRLFREDRVLDEINERCFIAVDNVDRSFNRREVLDFQEQWRRDAIVSIANVKDSENYESHFRLTREGMVEVYALGEGLEDGIYDYGWLTNDDTGEKVWEMRDEDSGDAGGATKNRGWRQTLTLQPGNYSVFFVTDDSHSPEEWNANPPYDPYSWGVTLRGIAGKFDSKSMSEYQKRIFKPFLVINRVGNESLVQKGFRLKRPAGVRIRAMGEGDGGNMFDYGWIVNAVNGEKVWEMSFKNTQHAGGAHKNRFADDVVYLKPGDYWVYYSTDGTHAYQSWNARPPRHGERWGISIELADEKDDISIIQPYESQFIKPVIDLTRIGDDVLVQAALSVEKPTAFRVIAMGEGDEDEMYDYGWIEDVRAGTIVWQMQYQTSIHAGGADKNRQSDEIITLARGTYTVFFQTDDSHAFGDWNSRQPRQPELYGIRLFAMEANTDNVRVIPPPPLPPGQFRQDFMSGQPPGEIIAQIVEARDDEHLRKTFSLDRETLVNLYAIGEGDVDEMVDYGWIEDRRSGRIVWKMAYRGTEHAGGARKNRMARGTIMLPPGQYILHYQTDSSHSFEDWNAAPPRDRFRYGITLYRAGSE